MTCTSSSCLLGRAFLFGGSSTISSDYCARVSSMIVGPLVFNGKSMCGASFSKAGFGFKNVIVKPMLRPSSCTKQVTGSSVAIIVGIFRASSASPSLFFWNA